MSQFTPVLTEDADALAEQLVKAVQKIDVDGVRAVLAKGTNPNTEYQLGYNSELALVEAAKQVLGSVIGMDMHLGNGSAEAAAQKEAEAKSAVAIMKMLIEAGADPRIEDGGGRGQKALGTLYNRSGDHPLFADAIGILKAGEQDFHDREIAARQEKAKIPLTEPQRELLGILKEGTPQQLKEHVERNKMDINEPFAGHTPLIYAVGVQRPEMVQQAVDLGAKVFTRDKEDKSADDYADEFKRDDISKILFKAGHNEIAAESAAARSFKPARGPKQG